MANFSVNQTKHVFVVKQLQDTVEDLANVKDIAVSKDQDGVKFLTYKGPAGLIRSDLLSNIERIKATPDGAMKRYLKQVQVELAPNVNPDDQNSTISPIAGQDYILRIVLKQYLGMSEEDQYFKYGAVRAYGNMTASAFYAEMALSLAKNFSREISKLFKFYVKTAGGKVEITPKTDISDFKDNTTPATAIIIEEQEQDWNLGTMQETSVNFEVCPSTVTVAGNVPSGSYEAIWGIVTELPKDENLAITNGKTMADMEYFFMGERGDQYRMIGWPNVIKTTYLVDPNKVYDTIDIHYSYIGSGEGVQKSEKDVLILVEKDATSDTVSAVTTEIVNALKA